MPYFTISNGLRGCYMPDSSHIIRATTRRELKAALEREAETMRDSYTGASKRAVAWQAAAAWREAHKARPSYFDIALPLTPRGASERARGSYGLFVAVSTRADYRDYLAQEDC